MFVFGDNKDLRIFNRRKSRPTGGGRKGRRRRGEQPNVTTGKKKRKLLGFARRLVVEVRGATYRMKTDTMDYSHIGKNRIISLV